MIGLALGDIVAQETDAIVNAANEMLAAGSGVSGAIHAAAGSHLEMECLQLGRCPPGEARITLGYKLKARFVIHAVAPRYWDGTHGEAVLLRQTKNMRTSTAMLEKHYVHTSNVASAAELTKGGRFKGGNKATAVDWLTINKPPSAIVRSTVAELKL